MKNIFVFTHVCFGLIYGSACGARAAGLLPPEVVSLPICLGCYASVATVALAFYDYCSPRGSSPRSATPRGPEPAETPIILGPIDEFGWSFRRSPRVPASDRLLLSATDATHRREPIAPRHPAAAMRHPFGSNGRTFARSEVSQSVMIRAGCDIVTRPPANGANAAGGV